MNKNDCKYEKISHWSVGVALLIIALGFSVISVTVLPIVGFAVAIPVFLLSFYFFSAPRSQECSL
jgi:hypothetical protein